MYISAFWHMTEDYAIIQTITLFHLSFAKCLLKYKSLFTQAFYKNITYLIFKFTLLILFSGIK